MSRIWNVIVLTLFLVAAIPLATAAASEATAAGVELHEATIASLQEEMAAGRLTSRALVEHFLARIESLDRHGPELHSVVEINPDALALADGLDEERRTKGPRGPLHGIPILLKDNIDTADSMQTTAGSLALMGSRPAKDAFLVARLREAGAVILGKTNLSEWANFRSTRSSSGWSARGGQTRNPFDTQRNPCGSSSGSAVAVAAGLAVAAVGTETDGSIVCPSSTNGIVGIKPTVGLVSRSGIVPISISQDTAGAMARTVEDAAVLLSAIAGEDVSDPASARRKPGTAPDLVAAAGEGSLRGVRIGVARNLAGFREEVDALFDDAIRKLTNAGAIIVDRIDLKVPKAVQDDELTVLLYEFKDGLNRYLGSRPGAPRSLAEVIAFNTQEREREMPYFGQELFLMAQSKGALTDKAYVRARKRSLTLAGARGIDAALEKYRLDAIIAPTGGPAWSIDLVNGDHFVGGDASTLPAVAGYPHITVPAGFVHGLPIGLSFFGTAWNEAGLIRHAAAFERISAVRRAPVLAPAVE
ncbi:MAG: amidase [Gammaproteobacteria bacterium]